MVQSVRLLSQIIDDRRINARINLRKEIHINNDKWQKEILAKKNKNIFLEALIKQLEGILRRGQLTTIGESRLIFTLVFTHTKFDRFSYEAQKKLPLL